MTKSVVKAVCGKMIGPAGWLRFGFLTPCPERSSRRLRNSRSRFTRLEFDGCFSGRLPRDRVELNTYSPLPRQSALEERSGQAEPSHVAASAGADHLPSWLVTTLFVTEPWKHLRPCDRLIGNWGPVRARPCASSRLTRQRRLALSQGRGAPVAPGAQGLAPCHPVVLIAGLSICPCATQRSFPRSGSVGGGVEKKGRLVYIIILFFLT